MNARIRNTVCMLLLALIAIPFQPAQAQQEQKSAVALLSVSSIDELLGNISYITEASGSGDVGQMISMMSNPYLQGIDRSNPIGMVLTTDGQEFLPLGFVPIKDLDKVFESLEETMGAPRDLGNGIKEIPGFQPIFIKEQNGWAFVGQTVESMANLPKNPIAALGNMPQEYDIAIRGNIQNIPKEYIDMAVNALQDGVTQGLQQLPEEERGNQEAMVKAQLKQMETYIKESDQITIGWKTEPAEQHTFIDMSFTAVPGSSLAKQMSTMANAKSDYTDFVLPGAALSMNMATEIPQEQIQTSIDAMENLKETAMREFARDEDMDDETRKTMSEMVGAAIDIFVATIQTGKMDGGASVMLEPGDITLLAGFHVADGKDVEKILKRMDEMAKKEPDFPGIKFNADKANGVTYHTMAVDVPDDEEARSVLGDRVEMAVGVSEDSTFIGFGKDCIDKLKNIVQSQTKQKPVKPFEMTVSATSIMEFVGAIENNPMIGSVTEALKEAGDKDHLKILGLPIKNGFIYRIELEEGILKGIGEAVKMANSF